MGLVFIDAVVSGPLGKQRVVNFLVDSGASYSLLPIEIWQALELRPKRTMSFALADGTRIERRISECHIVLVDHEGHTPVVLGDPGDDTPLLGSVTLENLGLVLDPFHRTLHAMELRLS